MTSVNDLTRKKSAAAVSLSSSSLAAASLLPATSKVWCKTVTTASRFCYLPLFLSDRCIHIWVKFCLRHSLSFCVQFSGHFSRWTWVSRYQNVSILDIIGANDDGSGGDNQSYNTCKAPVKSSSPTNQHPTFLQAGHPTNSVEALNGNLDEILWGNSAGG